MFVFIVLFQSIEVTFVEMRSIRVILTNQGALLELVIIIETILTSKRRIIIYLKEDEVGLWENNCA